MKTTERGSWETPTHKCHAECVRPECLEAKARYALTLNTSGLPWRMTDAWWKIHGRTNSSMRVATMTREEDSGYATSRDDGCGNQYDNAKLLVLAVNALPTLISRIDQLEAENEAIRKQQDSTRKLDEERGAEWVLESVPWLVEDGLDLELIAKKICAEAREHDAELQETE